MRKFLKLIFTFLLTLSFASCNKTDERILLEGNINNNNVKMIDSYQLQGMIEEEESFVLAVLLSTCSSCLTFKKDVLEPYILETHATIYAIDFNELESAPKFENKPYVKISPALFIYNEGEILASIKINKEEQEFTNLSSFKQFMSKYTIEPKLIEVSEDYLDQAIANKEDFVLYIGWNKCGDCKKLEEEILDDFLKNNFISRKFYYLESDPYRINKPSEKPVLPENPNEDEINKYNEDLSNWNKWLSFASKYHFDTYRNGRIPTLQFYSNGILNDMLVYNNDIYEDGVVIDSYFDEFDNMEITKEQLLKEHNKKANEFLNKYLIIKLK